MSAHIGGKSLVDELLQRLRLLLFRDGAYDGFTHDIAAALGKLKTSGQKLIGFALETNDEQRNAEGKLIRKNFDFIVLNSLNDAGAGFRYDTNKISILSCRGRTDYPLKSKTEVARDIIDRMIKEL